VRITTVLKTTIAYGDVDLSLCALTDKQHDSSACSSGFQTKSIRSVLRFCRHPISKMPSTTPNGHLIFSKCVKELIMPLGRLSVCAVRCARNWKEGSIRLRSCASRQNQNLKAHFSCIARSQIMLYLSCEASASSFHLAC